MSDPRAETRDLTPTARALFEAHVAFEMDQWHGSAAPERISAAVDAFWSWAQQTPLNSLVSADTVVAAAERLVLDMELPPELAGVIGRIADDLIRLDVNRETRVQDVVDEALFDDGVSLFVELEVLRNRLIQRALDSPVYAALASDVLYQGLKDYIFSDSGAINSIPGVSSLIKGSSSAVSKRLPGLEAQVEKRVRAYIENNTAKTLARSEQLLLDTLDEKRIRAIADEIWANVHDQTLSLDDVVNSEELQKLVDFGLRIWSELRETQYLGDMVNAGVTTYFQRYGNTPIAQLLGHIGVDRELLQQEGDVLAPPVIEGLAENGLLETLVRDRLAPFYRSEAFAEAVGKG